MSNGFSFDCWMQDLLPPQLLNLLRDRYLAGVADAEAKYTMSEDDEDALTGALGQSISMADPLVFQNNEQRFVVQISYRKTRGRGPDAPEKKFGTDGIFQIEVRDSSGRVTRQKGLPFQAKKGWIRKNSALAKQAALMTEKVKSGLVVDYSAKGYVACPAEYIEKVSGSRKDAERSGVLRPLGQMLAHDFLDCRIGQIGLFYDPGVERFVEVNLPKIAHTISTAIRRAD